MVFSLDTPQNVQKLEFSRKFTGFFERKICENAKIGNFGLEGVSKGNIV